MMGNVVTQKIAEAWRGLDKYRARCKEVAGANMMQKPALAEKALDEMGDALKGLIELCAYQQHELEKLQRKISEGD